MEIDQGRKLQHGDAAENALANDCAQCGPAQHAHPFTGFDALRPYRHHDDQQSDEFGDHAMGVLVLHSAHHGRQPVERTKRGWPVGHRQAGIIAGHQGAGDDEQKCGPGKNYGKAMVRRVVSDTIRSRRQNRLPITLRPRKAMVSLGGRCFLPTRSKPALAGAVKSSSGIAVQICGERFVLNSVRGDIVSNRLQQSASSNVRLV